MSTVPATMSPRVDVREEAAATGLAPILRHWWWLVVLLASVAALVGYLGASRATPSYESQVRVLVGPVEADLDTIRASSGLVQTYAGLVTSDDITEAAASRVAIEDLDDVVTSIRATANDVTRVLTVRVAAADPEVAASVANALVAELALISTTSDLETGAVRTLEAAEAGSATTDSQTMIVTALAAMVGLVAALGLALVLDRRSDRIRNLDDVERLAGLPILGTVTCRSADGRDPSTELSDLAGPKGSELRFVVSRIMQLALRSRGGNSLAVVPVIDGPMTSRFVRELALVVASTGRSVLVTTACRPEIPQANGDVIALSRFIARRVNQTLPRVPDGKVVTMVVDVSGPMLTAPEAIPTALGSFAEAAAVTILDLGGLDESIVGLSMTLAADVVLVMAHDGSIRRSDLVRTVEVLRDASAHVAGIVVVAESSKRRDRSENEPVGVAPACAAEKVAEATA